MTRGPTGKQKDPVTAALAAAVGAPSVATAAKGELLLEVASEGIAGVLQDPELWQNVK